MKTLAAALLVFCSASAFAAESQLLQNALSCKLKDKELSSLMRDLASSQPAMAKPSKQYGAPTADSYALPQSVSALGYASEHIVVTPGRILLAVPGTTLGQVVKALKLNEEPYAPARREVRPTVNIVAFQMSHPGLEDKVLVGCEYQNNDAAAWIQDDKKLQDLFSRVASPRDTRVLFSSLRPSPWTRRS